MASEPLFDPELAELLRRNRARVVPFVGAGAAISAGLPSSSALAVMIGEMAVGRGAAVVPREDFDAICGEVSGALGHEELQKIVSEIIGGVTVEPTALLTRIAHAPGQVIVTTNYDYGIEAAAEKISRKPITLHPRSALVTARPGHGELFVVHIHGVHDDPPSIVLPGRSMEDLALDEAFKTMLRGLLAPRLVLYLGYSFPDADAYLRSEIDWIRNNLTDTGEHALLLPRDEYERRKKQLAKLGASVRIFTFDSSRNFDAVQQAAVTIGPSRAEVTKYVERIVLDEADPNFATPPILHDEIDGESENRKTRAMMARLGMGDDRFIEPHELLDAGRSLVIAEPGMGKTQLLLHLGKISDQFAALYVTAKALAIEASPERDATTVLALALREAKAFDETTPLPTSENLPGTAYAVLIDGLDEVPARERASVVSTVKELARLYPQHAFVISTRPLLERTHAEELHSAGFSIYRLIPDDAWGQIYLRETRGIPEGTLNELYERLPRARELLAIPLYAKLIGDRLAEGVQALPDTALQLITEVGVGDAIRREAGKHAVSPQDLYRYMQTLALVLELRALNEARLEEALQLPAPPGLSNDATRTWLVEQALLKDLPDRVAFQTVTIQEGLAAEALLTMPDPLAAFHEVAVAEVAGELVIRSGIDHAVDLFFENAPETLREELRKLDELRWARTQSTGISTDEARETLDVIWRHFGERRNWIDSDRERELRDARAAVERIAGLHPELIDEMRQSLLDALQSGEETVRGNAVFYLAQAPFDDKTRDALRPLLRDTNPVVRRFVASAIADREEHALRDGLVAAYQEESDELAASEIAHALLALTNEGERLDTVRLLMANAIAWNRISYMAEGLPLDELLTILEETGFQNDDGRALERAIERLPADGWTEDLVRRLIALLVRASQQSYYQLRQPELLSSLAERFPDATLAGAESAAEIDPSYMDLTVLRFIGRDRLEGATEGPLGTQIRLLLELFIDRPAVAPSQPVAARSETPNLHEWISEDKLSTERCPTRETVLRGLLDQVEELSPEERDKLEEAVQAWWPEAPLADRVKTNGRNGEAPPCLPAALAGSAALDLPLPRERWIELLRVGALWFHTGASEWMAKNYPEDAEDEVVAHMEEVDDEYLLALTVQALPQLSDRLAAAFADAVIRIRDDNLTFRLDRLREEGKLEALRRVAEAAPSEVLRRAALRELARAGDVAGQREELEAMKSDLQANHRAYENEGLSWHGAVVEDLLPELGELLRLVSRSWSPSESQIGRTIVAAIASIGSEKGLAIYESLMDDAEANGGSFYWYERDRLRRQIAASRVLNRLPEAFDALAARLRDLGWQSGDESSV